MLTKDFVPYAQFATASPISSKGRSIVTRADRSTLLLTALLMLLPVLALVAPVNHDESQYLAAARLAGQGLAPFADFLSLQTPYQIYVFAPLIALFPAHGFIALRLLTGLIGVAMLLLVVRGQRLAGVAAPRARWTALAMGLAYPFLFSVTLVRNDALPALMLAAALVLALGAGSRPGFGRAMLCGLLLGFAIGTKVSYGLPALGFGLWLLVDGWRRGGVNGLSPAAGCLLGGVLALAPLVAIRVGARTAFDFGVLTFGVEGPAYWYNLNGFGHRLTWISKIGDFLGGLSVGAALPALLVVVATRWRQRNDTPAAGMLDAMIVAGIVAALIPTPTWRQYLLPLLPPLFIRLGMIWQARGERKLPKLATMIFAPFVLAGLVPVAIWAVRSMTDQRENPFDVTREAQWVGQRMRAHGLSGPVATLSPQLVVDAGVTLDPLFASGPFAYRSAPILPRDQWMHAGITGEAGLPGLFTLHPPSAIITGYESGDTMDRIGAERGLVAWAKLRCYAPWHSPHGQATLWLVPRAGTACPAR